MGITDDDFDDLEKLFEMFDRDKDGIINRKETQMALRCLGMKTSSEQVKIISCESSQLLFFFRINPSLRQTIC